MKTEKRKNNACCEILERDLRAWLKSVWSRGKSSLGLQWIEPAKGSSIGFPDVLIPVSPLLIPVELKVIMKDTRSKLSVENAETEEKNDTNFSYRATIRPAQRRFHFLMRREKIFSCYLTAIGKQNSFDVWLSDAVFWSVNKNQKPGNFLIARDQNISGSLSRIDFINVLKDFKQFSEEKLFFEN